MLSYILLALAAGLLLYGCWYAVFASPHPHRNDERRLPTGEQYDERADEMRALIEALLAVPCQSVSITSRDGPRLCARYYPGREGAAVAICFHGYRAAARRDFSGGARYLLDRGFHVLLIDEREHEGV